MITIDDIGLRISKLRLQKNVSAKNMSLLLGLNEGYISKLENSDGYQPMKSFFVYANTSTLLPWNFLISITIVQQKIKEFWKNLRNLIINKQKLFLK